MSKEKCPFCKVALRERYSEPPIYMWDCGTKRLPDGLTCRSDDCYERELAALKAELATAYAAEDPGDHARWRAAEQEIERLREYVAAMEEEASCLPEDYSVTEYVAHLLSEVERLEEDAADAQQVHEDTLTEPCDGGNEWHCSCVPHLRREIERLQALRTDELPLQWPCGCGFARAKIEVIDSGTVLCCEECGRQVVVRLEAIEEDGGDE